MTILATAAQQPPVLPLVLKYMGEGLLALITTGTLWKSFKLVGDWIQRSQSRQAFEEAVMIVETLHRLQVKLNAQRVMILKTENGGGIPHPGKPLYTSVQYEFCRDGVEPLKEDFQRRLLDSSYVEMIGKILSMQQLTLIPAEMPEGCMLSRVYRKFRVLRADVIEIAITKHGLFYLSCTWAQDSVVPDDVEIAYEIGVAQNKLRELLSK